MKYLKNINELRKETYLSAAKKLATRHPMRSKRLMDKADEVADIQYLHPYAFLIDNKRYYITDIKIVPYSEEEEEEDDYYIFGDDEEEEEDDEYLMESASSDEYVNFIIKMESVSDSIELKINRTYPYYDSSISLYVIKKVSNNSRHVTDFLFDNRKDARMLLHIIEKETGEKVPFPINDIYISK